DQPIADMSMIAPSAPGTRAGQRRPPLDHRNPVTASHLPGGEPEHALNDQVRLMAGRRRAVSSVFGAVSAEVAAMPRRRSAVRSCPPTAPEPLPSCRTPGKDDHVT